MKITKIFCRCILTHKGKLTYNFGEDTLIEYIADMRGYLLDKVTFVPESNVNQVNVASAIEQEVTEVTEEPSKRKKKV
jgi:hypothetical protein